MLTASCGGEPREEGRSPSTSVAPDRSTGSTGSTVSTRTVPASTSAPATPPTSAVDITALPSCDGLASYWAPTRWLPTVVPEDLEITEARVELWSGPGAATPGEEVVLAELDAHGTVGRSIDLVRGASEDLPTHEVEAPGTATIDQVRGRPGSVRSVLDRGVHVPHTVARWTEGRTAFSARTGDLDPVELASVLDGLDITPSSVTDRSGRFTVIGRTPFQQEGPNWRNFVFLHPRDQRLRPTLRIVVEISAPVPGAEGFTELAAVPGSAHIEDLDGTPAAFDGGLQAHLADRSLVRIYEQPLSTVATPDGGDGRFEQPRRGLAHDELVAMFRGLERVEPGDPRLGRISLTPPGWRAESVSDPLCREDS